MIQQILFYFRTTSSWGTMTRRFLLGFSVLETFLFLVSLQNMLTKEGRFYFLQEFGDTILRGSQFILLLLISVIAVLLYYLTLDFLAYLRISRLLGIPTKKIYVGLIEGLFLVGVPALLVAEGIATLLAGGIVLALPDFNIGDYLFATFITFLITLCLTLTLCAGTLQTKDIL